MVVNKYDFVTKKYTKVEIPDDWHTPLFTNNMKEIINCISCGTKIEYGEGYTSLKYHNSCGLGYCVCHKCYYEKEWVEKINAYKKEEENDIKEAKYDDHLN